MESLSSLRRVLAITFSFNSCKQFLFFLLRYHSKYLGNHNLFFFLFQRQPLIVTQHNVIKLKVTDNKINLLTLVISCTLGWYINSTFIDLEILLRVVLSEIFWKNFVFIESHKYSLKSRVLQMNSSQSKCYKVFEGTESIYTQ